MTEHDFSLEIRSLEELEAVLKLPQPLAGAVFSGLNLTDADLVSRLSTANFDDAIFFGCTLADELSKRVKVTGGMIFPTFDELPFNPYRTGLYTVPELLEGYVRGEPESIGQTLDARIYKYYTARHSFGSRPPVIETLACRIHDHAIDRALDNLLRPDDGPELKVVGIMGGHKLRRDDPGFLNVARIARRLTRADLFVATGGGPGAMEAGNMGSWFADADETALDSAVEILKDDPWYLDPHYVDRGYDVLDSKPTGRASLAIPTWFYGHEPSNLFSTRIAKYFANSIREDGLLTIATYGIIFSPGSAGTIQEIFQDAAQNHYNSVGVVSPMVFLGIDFWNDFRPVFPLIEAMSSGKPYHEMILITDDADEAVEFIISHPPRPDL